uniref:Uncharacterized protein n=1 Tax=Phakopsora pachyrhizi TaxID=170000 RepID=A0A0S1MJV4_PHAPC
MLCVVICVFAIMIVYLNACESHTQPANHSLMNPATLFHANLVYTAASP